MTGESAPADVEVLLVEDNPGDVRMVERAYEDRSLPGTLHVVRTAAEALDRLHGRGDVAGNGRPDLVLLDLNLPATDGHAVLESVKTDPELRRIPVVVLTSAQSVDELDRAYDGFANAVLVKPVDPEAFADAIEAFAEFWASAVVLPPVLQPDEGDGDTG